MSAEEVKAARVRPPYDYNAVTNDFGVLKFSGGVLSTETSHKVDAVPRAWQGQWVEIYATGGDLHYAFSRSSTAEVDRAVAATAAGASVKVGAVIPNGESRHVQIPLATPAGPSDTASEIYFARESSAIGTVAYMRLASGNL